MARYRFSELIDVGQLERLLELFHRVVGVPISIADVGDAPILHVGWQDVCVNFHRAVPSTTELCLISDSQARNVVLRESCFSYRCLNGLENVAVPILIEGEQVATLFVAQFFLRRHTYRFRLLPPGGCFNGHRTVMPAHDSVYR